MFTNPKNWTLKVYTNNQLTPLVVDGGTTGTIIQTAIVCPVDGSTANARIVITDSDNTELCTLMPSTEITGEAQRLDLRSVVLINGQKLQVEADGAGLEFFASGVDDA